VRTRRIAKKEHSMSLEICRVPLDFNAPLGETWAGFDMPKDLEPTTCGACNGSGESSAARALEDQWFDGPTGRRYSGIRYNFTAADIAVLRTNGLLKDFPHLTPEMDAASINEVLRDMFFGESEAKYHVIKARVEARGQQYECPICHGEMMFFRDAEHKAAYEAWETPKMPEGDGYQVWNTITEGSPISPVFADTESVAQWLNENKGMSLEHARNFVDVGWSPTGILGPMTGNTFVEGHLAVGAGLI
jgi:hypothetical protein